MDPIRQELERVYQLVTSEAQVQATAKLQAQRQELEQREAALAAAMELASVDPAVRAAFHDGIFEERSRWLALINERLAYFNPGTVIYSVLETLRRAGEAL
jgi:hypothetical protein